MRKYLKTYYMHEAHVQMLEDERARTGAPMSEILRRALEFYMLTMEKKRAKEEGDE